MKDNLHYFKVGFRQEGKEKTEDLLLAVRYPVICSKWIDAFRTACRYVENQAFAKETPVNEQVIEMLDDSKGEATLYRRKGQNLTPSPKKTISILNLPLESDKKQTKPFRGGKQDSASLATQEDMLRES